MRDFAALYAELDAATGTADKVRAMVGYFQAASARDAAWATHILAGGKLARLVRSGDLRDWLVAASGHPPWLVEETYAHVGDLAETITLMRNAAPIADADALGLADWIEQRLLPLKGLPPAEQGALIRSWWLALPDGECFVLNKLLTGALRVGVSQRLLVQALAALSGLARERVAHRLTGTFAPTPAAWAALVDPAAGDAPALDQPYPFFLASPLESAPDALGDPADWQLEWKWDGIRAQLIRRGDGVHLWSRGEERLGGRFPEIEAAARALPEGCVLDGEILGWQDGAPLPFARLQTRIGRRKPGAKTLADCPVVFMAYDLLEADGEDWRMRPLEERRARLEALLVGQGKVLRQSPAWIAEDWASLGEQRARSRQLGVEGLMLKRLASPYRVGRARGDWWKWKIEPLTIDAVLVYAQPGHGRRANLYTDYTFALWDGERLVPVAKAYSGLDDAEISRLDRWIRAHTIERFGPVRSVEPVQVFELAFEGVQASGRHKSGVAVRFPRILRWRSDKPAAGADRLETLRRLAD